jgi:TrmH family RNA methyltransferase
MITSTSNPLIKRVRKLRRKKHRLSEGAFFIDGVRVFISAVEAKAPIQTILYSPDLLTSELALEVISTRRKAGVKCVETSAMVFRSISSRDNPVGVGAIVSIRWVTLEDLAIRRRSVYVALLNISEPGNLGTIIRTVDAAGADGVVLVGDGVDPYHPSAVKASMGTLFNVPISHAEVPVQLLDWARTKGITSVATSAHAQQSYRGDHYELPSLILLGSEGDGLPAALLDKADLAVSIPMRGTASSLNLAVAAGLLIYEVTSTAS